MRAVDEPETVVTSPELDDIDARPGSTVSILRTFVGLFLRDIGGWIATRDLIRLMRDAGVAEQAARNGIARLKTKELLVPEASGVSGYRLNPRARSMLERGDRRIFSAQAMQLGDPWCLISFTVEERRRAVRHQMRRRLQWLGCGTVAPGLWIAPAMLRDEIALVAETLGVNATLFVTGDPTLVGPARRSLTEAAASWWDFETIARTHATFLEATREHPALDDAFAAYIRVVDLWRPIPYTDPGLPRDILPPDWPGEWSARRFTELRNLLEHPARQHVRAVIGSTGR